MQRKGTAMGMPKRTTVRHRDTWGEEKEEWVILEDRRQEAKPIREVQGQFKPSLGNECTKNKTPSK